MYNNKYIDQYYNAPTACNKQLAVLSMTRFIFKIVNRYSNMNNRDDLLQQGYIGVLRALETYDSNKSAFATHAHYQILDFVMRYLKDQTNRNNQTDALAKIEAVDSRRHFDAILDVDKKIMNYQEEHKQQFALAAQGWTSREIAKRYNVSKSLIDCRVKRMKEHLKSVLTV